MLKGRRWQVLDRAVQIMRRWGDQNAVGLSTSGLMTVPTPDLVLAARGVQTQQQAKWPLAQCQAAEQVTQLSTRDSMQYCSTFGRWILRRTQANCYCHVSLLAPNLGRALCSKNVPNSA